MAQEERDQFELKQFILTHWQKRTTVHWAMVVAFFACIGFLTEQHLDHPNFDVRTPMIPILLCAGIFIYLWWKEATTISILLHCNKLTHYHLSLFSFHQKSLKICGTVSIGCIAFAFVLMIYDMKSNCALLIVFLLFIILPLGMDKLQSNVMDDISKQVNLLASKPCVTNESHKKYYNVVVQDNNEDTLKNYIITINEADYFSNKE